MKTKKGDLKDQHSIARERLRRREDRILARDWRPWQKVAVTTVLTISLIISSLALFQSLGIITGVYYQFEVSTARRLGLLLSTGGLLIFTGWAIASARLLSRFVADWIFDQI